MPVRGHTGPHRPGVSLRGICADNFARMPTHTRRHGFLIQPSFNPHSTLPTQAWVPLRGSSGRLLGAAVRAAGTANPIYASVGHRVSLDTAVAVLRRCCLHRIPEPVRQARDPPPPFSFAVFGSTLSPRRPHILRCILPHATSPRDPPTCVAVVLLRLRLKLR